MATLLKWAQNTQGKLSSNKTSTNGERKWIHPPEALQKGHIAYLVKSLGNLLVDEAKGIEVAKEAIRKLKFSQQLRKSETGAKTKKVELTISIDGVAIQEPRTHAILHQFPLHQISYCADDKGEKKLFSFIAKHHNQGDESDDKHECFVFISDKLAEEITLTIGQAFELAYRRFLDSSGKDLETQRKAMVLQQKIKRSEQEVNIYKQRLLEISQIASIRSEIDQYLRKYNLKNILDIDSVSKQNGASSQTSQKNGHTITTDLVDIIDLNGIAPPVPPRASENVPTVGTKLEGLLLNELEHDDFNPRSFENNNTVPATSNLPLIAPPPKPAKRNNLTLNVNLDTNIMRADNLPRSGSTPSAPNSISSAKIDPFEMGDFGGGNSTTSQDIENAIGLLDKRINEMKAGFTRGISFGNDDFSLESLDPLKN